MDLRLQQAVSLSLAGGFAILAPLGLRNGEPEEQPDEPIQAEPTTKTLQAPKPNTQARNRSRKAS